MQATNTSQQLSAKQNRAMRSYYQLHARIYDATRWSFLFGRKQIIQLLVVQQPHPKTILEIGCGTGYNLIQLSKAFPKAQLIGMDVSGDMLSKAKKNTQACKKQVTLMEQPYTLEESSFKTKIDIVLFSYALSMINPQWESLIQQAANDLAIGGVIGITDFYDSPFTWFKQHMGNNHVRMDGHLNPVLQQYFQTEHEHIHKAYGGVWQYFTYVGRKL